MEEVNMLVKLFLKIIFVFLFISHSSLAANTADPDAKSVSLEIICEVGQNNCFDNLPDLIDWINNTRTPDSTSALTVNVGNGTFLTSTGNLALVCDEVSFTGYVHFIGEGASNSKIHIGQQANPSSAAFFNVSGCEGMEFSDITFRTIAPYGYINWSQGGTSKWNNVEVYGKGGAWSENNCATNEGLHNWYSSKLTSEPSFGKAETYAGICDKSWLFGSEVTSIVPQGTSAGTNTAVISFSSSGRNVPEVHLYGSNVRAISYGTVTNPETYMRGTVHAGQGGQVHIHGTGIDSISESGQDIYVITAQAGGFIHANDSAYVIETTGNARRIANAGGVIKAPYMWEQRTSAPQISSVNGADTFVDISEAIPVMYIYYDGCVSSGGPWVSTSGQCRL